MDTFYTSAMAPDLYRGPAALARLLNRLDAWRRRRETLAELSKLSDSELDDIGLTRWQIPEVVEATSGGSQEPLADRQGILWGLYRSWVRRSAIRELNRLPDRLLLDIGLTRSEIPGVVEATMRAARRPVEASRSGAVTSESALHRIAGARSAAGIAARVPAAANHDRPHNEQRGARKQVA